MELNLEELPIIDKELGIRLAGNQPDLAHDMIVMLSKGLPQDLADINHAFTNNDYPELLRYVHKLHGAVAYCGTPRLKEVLAQIETKLKRNMKDEIPTLMQRLQVEVHDLLCHPGI